MTGLDWTAHSGMCVSLSPSLCLSLSGPIVSSLGKTFAICPHFIKAFKSLWLPLFHKDFLWLVAFSLCVWCVNTHSFIFKRLTRIHTKNTQSSSHMWHESPNRAGGTRLHYDASKSLCNKKLNLKRQTWNISCVQTHHFNRVQTNLLSPKIMLKC